MLKWLNAFSFCLWKHENKSWIRGPNETELILILILYLNIYKRARKWNRGNEAYPKAVLDSKTRSTIWFSLHYLPSFSKRPQPFLHSLLLLVESMANRSPEKAFHFPISPHENNLWGQTECLSHVLWWHPQFRLLSHLILCIISSFCLWN